MAHFIIEGEYITHIARLRVLEDDWRHALRIMDCVSGLSMEEQIAILKGESYLQGNDDIQLLADDRKEAADYKLELARKFNCVWEYDKKFYEPYAHVTFSDEMGELGSKALAFVNKLQPTIEHGYTMFYADNDNDFPYQYNKKNYLFTFTQKEVPFFLESLLAQTPEEAIEKSQFLEKRGGQDPEEYYEKIRASVMEYADKDREYGWRTLTDEQGRTLRVPGRAFLHYSLQVCLSFKGVDKMQACQSLPVYEAISPSGLKMTNDNPIHTDVFLGAGLSLENPYEQNWQNELILLEAGKHQLTELNYDFHILTRANLNDFHGTTCNPSNYQTITGKKILVLPHLGVEFEAAARACDAIICEQGGPLAHLVTVSRESKPVPIIRINEACLKFKLPKVISLDLINGKIHSKKAIKKSP